MTGNNADSGQDELDAVFRALSHPDRRKILDLLKRHPGSNVNDLTEGFSVTRYAVMKHLRILGEADLVVSRKEGTSRLLYLNVLPVQMITDRWIQSFAALWAPAFVDLKRRLETDTPQQPADPSPDCRLLLESSQSAEDVWGRLTSEAFLTRHVPDISISMKGDSLQALQLSLPGAVGFEGTVLTARPGRYLQVAWKHEELQEESIIEILCTPVEHGSRCSLSSQGGEGSMAADLLACWSALLVLAAHPETDKQLSPAIQVGYGSTKIKK